MNRIGTTETGDPGYNFSWVDHLYDANILITKNPCYQFRKYLMENDRYKKCIVHLTCTGWGGSKFEPNVQLPQDFLKNVLELIDMGFPVEQLVLRVDPIIPSESGLNRAASILEMFGINTKIRRVRVSILDLYPHVKERIYNLTKFMVGYELEEYRLPWDNWFVPKPLIDKTAQMLNTYYQHFQYEYEACAEPELVKRSEGQIKPIGCVSQKDLDILGCTSVTIEEGPSRQRKTCLCPPNKYQLLSGKPGRCSNKCIYCYLKND